ncbi:amidohydrolase family protein [Rhizobium sp. L245/93]|uniref:amidohydrolase family protein n=1 Tax=Rhizobium sp. L245/93 TaxID=2819998 RepID=UPI001ADC1243|nr:amidohydrolase family protein [Rhizobium sp. L245/93]MBO9171773.1 amidohydrolase [Rhizobium sp. L245/93]
MTRLCGCRGIDVHCHVVPSEFAPYLKGAPPSNWPSMMARDACHRTIVIDGKNYRTVSDACWDSQRRMDDMDRMGIKTQALSPMPELFNYWMDIDPANDLIHYLNDTIATMASTSGGRFVGLGSVPLQDVDKAIDELRRCMRDLGFSGVEIGSNINGIPIGDPRFLPFFAEAEALGAAVFVHAVRPTGMDRLVGPGQLQQVLAYPTDVGLAAASVITANLMLKHPRLRLAFSHGGGTLASLLPRLDEGWKVFPALRETILEEPSIQAKRLYYDALVYDEPTLRHLVSMFGDERVILGTDYPFNFHEKAPLARIEAAFGDDLTRDRLTFSNAEAFLALEAQS